MSEDDTKANPDAADQDEDTGDDLDNNDDTHTGADDDAPDTGDDDNGDDAGDDNAGDDDAEQRFKDQQGRAKKAEKQAKDYKQRLIDAGLDPETGKKKEKAAAPKKDGPVLSDEQEQRIAKAEDRAERAELRSMGITHADDVQYVRDAAKRLGVDVTEAAEDELVKSKLERMQAARKTKDATPAPRKAGGGGSGNNIAKLADKVAAGGELPSDPALAEKVQQELARRSGAAA